MKELEPVLAAFRDAFGCEGAVWERPALEGSPPRVLARTSQKAVQPDAFPKWDDEPLRTNDGAIIVAPIPGDRHRWLSLGPCESGSSPESAHLRMLLPLVTQVFRGAMEVEHAAMDLAERYEEINLLYTIGEILGRTVTLEDAAATILTEISETVGARHGSILVHEPSTDTLNVVASMPPSPDPLPRIPVDDPASVSARVFRTEHAASTEASGGVSASEAYYHVGEMLSVPIMWTTPEGGEALGVVNLADRRSKLPYSAGDQKLVAAIATQIGTAIQNARLVRSSLEQQRLVHEMQLAHDLQMKLLPNGNVVAPLSQVAARVVPAESVGGDFYHLFKLQNNCTGVMIGDVSGHGYRAALIMALVMSAAAIHAQTTPGPGEMLSALLSSVREELETTEMFVSIFYAIVDHESHVLRYANTGHPHAFIFGSTGKLERLRAMDPPLGMVGDHPTAASYPWRAGHDLLILFTDGIPDAESESGERLGEDAVLRVIEEHASDTPEVIVDRVFELLATHMGVEPPRDDLTIVVLRS